MPGSTKVLVEIMLKPSRYACAPSHLTQEQPPFNLVRPHQTAIRTSSMSKIINVDFHLIWEPPVFVRTADGHRQRIDGLEAALQVLNRTWSSAVRSPLRCRKAQVRRCNQSAGQHRPGATDFRRGGPCRGGLSMNAGVDAMSLPVNPTLLEREYFRSLHVARTCLKEAGWASIVAFTTVGSSRPSSRR